MSLLIKGMEMPTKENVVILISPNGDVWMIGNMPNEDTHLVKAKAVPVQPHGRLGDLDRLAKEVKDMAKEFPPDSIGTERYRLFAEFIKTAPTIIPAEDKGYILAPQEEYDGLKRKYVVLKSDTGEIVENCFVLRPDKDKDAIAALLAYAGATANQVLAKDIRAWISTILAEEGK